jgi:hypothetical protein
MCSGLNCAFDSFYGRADWRTLAVLRYHAEQYYLPENIGRQLFVVYCGPRDFGATLRKMVKQLNAQVVLLLDCFSLHRIDHGPGCDSNSFMKTSRMYVKELSSPCDSFCFRDRA